MNAAQLPVSVVTASCPRCKLPRSFRVFESGAGGEFATYLGTSSGALYRLDLAKLSYLRVDPNGLLEPAQVREGGPENLVQVPNEVTCIVCGEQFGNCAMRIDREETIAAFVL